MVDPEHRTQVGGLAPVFPPADPRVVAGRDAERRRMALADELVEEMPGIASSAQGHDPLAVPAGRDASRHGSARRLEEAVDHLGARHRPHLERRRTPDDLETSGSPRQRRPRRQRADVTERRVRFEVVADRGEGRQRVEVEGARHARAEDPCDRRRDGDAVGRGRVVEGMCPETIPRHREHGAIPTPCHPVAGSDLTRELDAMPEEGLVAGPRSRPPRRVRVRGNRLPGELATLASRSRW